MEFKSYEVSSYVKYSISGMYFSGPFNNTFGSKTKVVHNWGIHGIRI